MANDKRKKRNEAKKNFDIIQRLIPTLENTIKIFSQGEVVLPKQCKQSIAFLDTLYQALEDLSKTKTDANSIYLAQETIADNGIKDYIEEYQTMYTASAMQECSLRELIHKELTHLKEQINIIKQEYYPTK